MRARAALLLALVLLACSKRKAAPPEAGARAPGERSILAEQTRFALALYFTPAPKVGPNLTRARCAAKGEGLTRTDEFATLLELGKPGFAVENLYGGDAKPPSAELLKYFGRGVSAEQVEAVQASKEAWGIFFVAPGARQVALLKSAGALAECMAKETGGLIWDEATPSCSRSTSGARPASRAGPGTSRSSSVTSSSTAMPMGIWHARSASAWASSACPIWW